MYSKPKSYLGWAHPRRFTGDCMQSCFEKKKQTNYPLYPDLKSSASPIKQPMLECSMQCNLNKSMAYHQSSDYG